jgi:hypothetical protein
MGFGMIIECNGHLILVTTNNIITFTIPYGLKVTTATYMCYVLTSLYLVTALGNVILLVASVPLSVLAHNWLLSTPLAQLTLLGPLLCLLYYGTHTL